MKTTRWSTRAVVFLVVQVLLFGASDPLQAQQGEGELLVNNQFNIDLVNGPVLGSGRIISLGGAYTALAFGNDGAPWTPTAYAAREISDTSWFTGDLTLSLSLASRKNTDFDNNGRVDLPYKDFTFWTVGGSLQFGALGMGANTRLQTHKIGHDTELGLAISNIGFGYMLLDGQLVLGVGGRSANLAITDFETKTALVNFSGIGAEAGILVRPLYQRWRLGIAARSPVSSEIVGNIREESEVALQLPRLVYLPWEIQIGFAWQFGNRPFNRRWINPHDVEEQLRKEMLLKRWKRAQKQVRREQRIAARDAAHSKGITQRKTDNKKGVVDPTGRPSASRFYPKDEQWWKEEKYLREGEEEAFERAVEQHEQERETAVKKLSRQYLLVSSEIIVVGPTTDGVGLESFLTQRHQVSGKDFSTGLRVGAELEPIENWLKVRAGGYLEPSRFARIGYRPHATVGLEFKTFSLEINHLLDMSDFQIGAALDLAARYINFGIGVGIWH